jgi:hypothetical protein
MKFHKETRSPWRYLYWLPFVLAFLLLLSLCFKPTRGFVFRGLGFVEGWNRRGSAEQFVRVEQLIREGERKEITGASVTALPYYLIAWFRLSYLQQQDPAWEPALVTYRLQILEKKMGRTTNPLPPPTR